MRRQDSLLAAGIGAFLILVGALTWWLLGYFETEGGTVTAPGWVLLVYALLGRAGVAAVFAGPGAVVVLSVALNVVPRRVAPMMVTLVVVAVIAMAAAGAYYVTAGVLAWLLVVVGVESLPLPAWARLPMARVTWTGGATAGAVWCFLHGRFVIGAIASLVAIKGLMPAARRAPTDAASSTPPS